MATQLHAIVDNTPATIGQIATGLDKLRNEMFINLPEAEEISFAFGKSNVSPGRLKVAITTSKREDRDLMLFKLRNNMIPELLFDKIVEGVETGARRRLTLTAVVR